MNIYYLYALLPLIAFPLTSIYLSKYSREIGSLPVSFLRQASLGLVGIPVIFIFPDFFISVQEYWKEILLGGFFGSLYVFSIYKSCGYLEVIQGRVINVVSRVLFSVLVGILVIGEVISLPSMMGIATVLVGISLYLRIHNENVLPNYNLSLGVAINIIGGLLFVGSQYYFNIYANELPPLMSAYFLEIGAIPFLTMMLIGIDRKGIGKLMAIDKGLLQKVFLSSIPALLGSYGLAQAYSNLSFILVNVLFCATLIVAGVLGWLILGEKLTKLQIIIFSLILVGIFIVNTF